MFRWDFARKRRQRRDEVELALVKEKLTSIHREFGCEAWL